MNQAPPPTLAIGPVQGSHVGSRMVSRRVLAALRSQVQDLQDRVEGLEEQVELFQSGELAPDLLSDNLAGLQLSVWACRNRLTALEADLAALLRSLQSLWDFVTPDGPSPEPPSSFSADSFDLRSLD